MKTRKKLESFENLFMLKGIKVKDNIFRIFHFRHDISVIIIE